MQALSMITALTLMSAAAGMTQAASVTISNPSFELPGLADTSISFAIEGWTVSGAGGNAVGTWNPPASVLTPTDGEQVAFMNTAGGSISQTLSDVLEANTLYTLQADVLARSDFVNNVSSTLQLLTAAGDILGSDTIGVLPKGSMHTLQVTYFAEPTDVNLGENLKIVLIGGGVQSDWDNVRLDATVPVPEPETWAMLLAGLGLVGWAARRRTA